MLDPKKKFICRINSTCKKINGTDLSVEIGLLFMKRSSKYSLLIFLLLCLCQNSSAQQREANVWYFGRYLGLDFNSGAPVALNDGQLNTTEGVATISNANGNLLFYTDGIKIWNRLHQVMPNGINLNGNPSSTQSAVIVPKIGDTTRYFVFTVDQIGGPKGLCYSVVNISLDGGKGDVELKNVPLLTNVTEKVTAVRHCNNRDIWVLTHGTASDTYYSFLVTAAGVNTVPVISHSGVLLPGIVPPSLFDSSTLGYLKASPDGKRIAAVHWTVNADVSDFNNATGIVSNSVSLFQPGEPHYLGYGIEFSPNSKLLYTTVFYTDINAQKKNALFQYDVSLSSPAPIIASKQVISQSFDPIQVYAALQIAPDGKMYMAKNIYKHIARINNPDVYGTGCNFLTNAVQWTGVNQESSFGLPTFIQSYFYPIDSFSYSTGCDLNVNFMYTPQPNVLSVEWHFGDAASGSNNISTAGNPSHLFSAAGTYNVMLIKTTSCGPDTIHKQVTTNGVYVNLGADTIVCGGNALLLSPVVSGSSNNFLWQDGSTNTTFNATASGQYWVQISNSLGCLKRDTINVTFKQLPVFNLGVDTSICNGDTLTLNATATGATGYLWNNGTSGPILKAFQTGLYWCEVNNGGCKFRDSLTITAVNPKPVVTLGNDSTLCGNGPVVLMAGNPGASYLWQDGNTGANYSANASGVYWVQVKTADGCTSRDSINLLFTSAPVFNLGADRELCAGDTVALNATAAGATGYLWNNGATTSSIRVFQTGVYWCEADNDGCKFRDTLAVTGIKPLPFVNLGNDQTVCEGVIVTLDATYPNAVYLWQNGSTNPVFNVTVAGTYFVQLDLNGCKRSDTVVISYDPKPAFTLGPDQSICPGNKIILSPVLNNQWQINWQDGTVNPVFSIHQPGIYTLSATNECGTTIDEMEVANGLCKVYVPTGFTPNNDGKNDLFRALGTESVTHFELIVFDRGGQIIFRTNDKLKGWDGKLNGMPLSSGIFVYILSFKETGSTEWKMIKGTIALIR
jgi:gliding motility-associated-like protein